MIFKWINITWMTQLNISIWNYWKSFQFYRHRRKWKMKETETGLNVMTQLKKHIESATEFSQFYRSQRRPIAIIRCQIIFVLSNIIENLCVPISMHSVKFYELRIACTNNYLFILSFNIWKWLDWWNWNICLMRKNSRNIFLIEYYSSKIISDTINLS